MQTIRTLWPIPILCGLAGLLALLVGTSALPLSSWRDLPTPCLVAGSLLWLLSVALVVWIVRLALEIRREKFLPSRFFEEMSEAVAAGDLKEAVCLARLGDSFAAKVLAAGLARLPAGLDAGLEAAYRTALALKAEKQRQVEYLAVIAALAVLVGLGLLVATLMPLLG